MADFLNPDQDCNDLIESQLTKRGEVVEKCLDADLVFFSGEIATPAVALLKAAIEHRKVRRSAVAVLLETPGGYIEDAERIANILRHHYKRVVFVVTTQAMSAGTVLVMSGDAIYMDYSSTLGPIDPQLEREGSAYVPALGYLEQYDRLIEKSANGDLTTAELAYLVQNFDAAELYMYEQARDLSIALLKEWLVKYKFANWTVTETKGQTVTESMREERAEEIANKLNKTERWHSHSRGISMEVLQQDLKLQIENIDKTSGLRDALQLYVSLLSDYTMRRGHYSIALQSEEVYHGH